MIDQSLPRNIENDIKYDYVITTANDFLEAVRRSFRGTNNLSETRGFPNGLLIKMPYDSFYMEVVKLQSLLGLASTLTEDPSKNGTFLLDGRGTGTLVFSGAPFIIFSEGGSSGYERGQATLFGNFNKVISLQSGKMNYNQGYHFCQSLGIYANSSADILEATEPANIYFFDHFSKRPSSSTGTFKLFGYCRELSGVGITPIGQFEYFSFFGNCTYLSNCKISDRYIPYSHDYFQIQGSTRVSGFDNCSFLSGCTFSASSSTVGALPSSSTTNFYRCKNLSLSCYAGEGTVSSCTGEIPAGYSISCKGSIDYSKL